MRAHLLVFGLLATFVTATIASPSAVAGHNEDFHSPNMVHLANVPHSRFTNSDLAFWGKVAYAGHFGGFRVLQISDPTKPTVLAEVRCNGAQGDVGVWDKLLFVSVDRPQTTEDCSSANTNPMATQPGFEGIRIFDVSNPRRPAFLKGVATNCGSHTHTVVPDLGNDRVLLYVSHSLPSLAPSCTPSPTVSIVEVPLSRPQDASVIASVYVSPAESCHDIGVYLPLKVAAAACITEGQLWDISDPANPVVTTHIVNAEINIWHSGGFTWDGRVVIFGDEFAGAALDGGCADPDDSLGRIWFYDRLAPASPVGSYKIPRAQGVTELCTAHNYNVIPLKTRYVLVSAFYEGGTTVVEFTIPAQPREIAFYDFRDTTVSEDLGLRGAWSSYWYNGHIYVSDIARGLDVLRFLDPEVSKATTLHHMNPQTREKSL